MPYCYAIYVVRLNPRWSDVLVWYREARSRGPVRSRTHDRARL